MLNPNTLYRKTEAGAAEVQARALGLRAELRRLLILIDGHASLTRLATFVRGSEIDFLIAELEVQGLITSAPIARTISSSTATVTGPSVTAQVAQSGNGGLLEPTAAQVTAVRRAAIRTLHEILGPGADALAVRIERCKDSQELRVTITEVRQILDRQIGVAVGQRFLDAVRGAAAEGTR